MSHDRQKPVRIAGGMHDQYEETHPAYAMIGASRVSSSHGAVLFGTDFRHQHYMTITIRGAHLSRTSTNSDHIGAAGDPQYIEVALSEAQWNTLVASANVGYGVPCTLQWRNGEYLPAIDPITDRREQFRGEVDDNLRESIEALDELIAEIDAGKGKRILREKAEAARRQLKGLTWVAQQFDEHAEETIEHARIEVNAHIARALQSAGLDAINAGAMPLLELAEPEREVKDV